MNKELGITQESYACLLDKIGIEPIYNFCTKYMPGQIGLYHYIDARGRFMPNKYKQDIIAEAIFNGLEVSEKMNVLQYLEEKEDGEF